MKFHFLVAHYNESHESSFLTLLKKYICSPLLLFGQVEFFVIVVRTKIYVKIIKWHRQSSTSKPEDFVQLTGGTCTRVWWYIIEWQVGRTPVEGKHEYNSVVSTLRAAGRRCSLLAGQVFIVRGLGLTVRSQMSPRWIEACIYDPFIGSNNSRTYLRCP